jgi:uncharacterized coiled-coil DUF342 family protein
MGRLHRSHTDLTTAERRIKNLNITLQGQEQSLKRSLQEGQQKVDMLKQQNETLRTKYETTVAQLRQVSQEKEVAVQRNDELNELQNDQKRKYEEERQQLEGTIRDQTQTLEETTRQLTAVQNQLQAMENEGQEKIQSLEAEKDDLQRQITELREELDGLTSTLMEEEDEKEVVNRVEELRNKRKALEAQLAETEEALENIRWRGRKGSRIREHVPRERDVELAMFRAVMNTFPIPGKGTAQQVIGLNNTLNEFYTTYKSTDPLKLKSLQSALERGDFDYTKSFLLSTLNIPVVPQEIGQFFRQTKEVQDMVEFQKEIAWQVNGNVPVDLFNHMKVAGRGNVGDDEKEDVIESLFMYPFGENHSKFRVALADKYTVNGPNGQAAAALVQWNLHNVMRLIEGEEGIETFDAITDPTQSFNGNSVLGIRNKLIDMFHSNGVSLPNATLTSWYTDFLVNSVRAIRAAREVKDKSEWRDVLEQSKNIVRELFITAFTSKVIPADPNLPSVQENQLSKAIDVFFEYSESLYGSKTLGGPDVAFELFKGFLTRAKLAGETSINFDINRLRSEYPVYEMFLSRFLDVSGQGSLFSPEENTFRDKPLKQLWSTKNVEQPTNARRIAYTLSKMNEITHLAVHAKDIEKTAPFLIHHLNLLNRDLYRYHKPNTLIPIDVNVAPYNKAELENVLHLLEKASEGQYVSSQVMFNYPWVIRGIQSNINSLPRMEPNTNEIRALGRP